MDDNAIVVKSILVTVTPLGPMKQLLFVFPIVHIMRSNTFKLLAHFQRAFGSHASKEDT